MSAHGDIHAEVLDDPALNDLWREPKEDKDFHKSARVVADKAAMDVKKIMNSHPINELKVCMAKLSVIEKGAQF